MKTFTDTAGRTWSVSLNLGTAQQVKDALKIDLLQPEMPYTGDLPSGLSGEALAKTEASAKEGPPLLTRLGTDELLLGGCGIRTVYVPHGTPVRLRETVKDVKVWVKDADGKPVLGRMDLPEGWYALPMPRAESGASP